MAELQQLWVQEVVDSVVKSVERENWSEKMQGLLSRCGSSGSKQQLPINLPVSGQVLFTSQQRNTPLSLTAPLLLSSPTRGKCLPAFKDDTSSSPSLVDLAPGCVILMSSGHPADFRSALTTYPTVRKCIYIPLVQRLFPSGDHEAVRFLNVLQATATSQSK
ncbi:Protein FAM136A [Tupaia chinensis]|uniref:Protein FAM136A n=1 Tax=Tupaia chinensis TaxID=246437 RepID=L9LGD8_TUPCH|nr:Protein FAM136A [Tupaia chinensis]